MSERASQTGRVTTVSFQVSNRSRVPVGVTPILLDAQLPQVQANADNPVAKLHDHSLVFASCSDVLDQPQLLLALFNHGEPNRVQPAATILATETEANFEKHNEACDERHRRDLLRHCLAREPITVAFLKRAALPPRQWNIALPNKCFVQLFFQSAAKYCALGCVDRRTATR